MPLFARKSSGKHAKQKSEKRADENKNKESKKLQTKKSDYGDVPEHAWEEEVHNGVLGVQQCKRLLASCPPRVGAKCVGTFRRKSELSKGLSEVLLDDSVLPYFMEYMQKHNATNLLNFWLTTETFRLSTLNRLKINSMSRLKHSSEVPKPRDSLAKRPVKTPKVVIQPNSEPNEQGNLEQSTKESCPQDDGICACGVDQPHSDVFADCGHSCNAASEPDLQNSVPGGERNTCENVNVGICTKHERDPASEERYWPQVPSVSSLLDVPDGQLLTKPGRSSSRVTFDLEPDYDDKEREFCRRRTRSIVIDAVSIYSKYISLEASHPLTLDESLRRQIESNICSEDGMIDPDCFVPAQKFVFDVMEKVYFPTFRQSSSYIKHQIDILTSGKVFLSDILYNETALFYFMEFLEQEGVQHMLEFWLTAENFQAHLQSKVDSGACDAEAALSDAMVIYEKYFSMQARMPLGVDDLTRIEIENSICREGGPLPDCFALPMEHILHLLEEVLFPSFLRGEVYFKYLSELLSSVSDRSVATSARSSAAVTQEGPVQESTGLLTSYGPDQDLTEDPDAIWHRPNAGPLSLGKVNEFGIFEPIFEPDPDSGSGASTASKLGKAMRKLVSGGEDKAKEEMAWKIAKMIIDDVQTQQQGGELGDLESDEWSPHL